MKAQTITIEFADGWKYAAPSGRAKPERIKRILKRLEDPKARVDSVLFDMPGAERMWIKRYASARAAYEKEQRALAAAAKVAKWKEENGVAANPPSEPPTTAAEDVRALDANGGNGGSL